MVEWLDELEGQCWQTCKRRRQIQCCWCMDCCVLTFLQKLDKELKSPVLADIPLFCSTGGHTVAMWVVVVGCCWWRIFHSRQPLVFAVPFLFWGVSDDCGLWLQFWLLWMIAVVLSGTTASCIQHSQSVCQASNLSLLFDEVSPFLFDVDWRLDDNSKIFKTPALKWALLNFC